MSTETGTIIGVVSDSGGRALIGGRIGLRASTAPEGTELRVATTDSVGAFVLTNLREGTYTVTARAIGFVPESFAIVACPGGVDTVRFRLEYRRCTLHL